MTPLMRKLQRSAAMFLFAILFIAGCRKDTTVLTGNYQKYPNIVYGTDTAQQKMDIFVNRNNKGNCPVVVLIHGGAWIQGSKDDFTGLGIDTFFAANGFAVVTMNYRLDGNYPYPSALDDVGLALASLAQHAGDWQIDPHRVCLFGRSSGSQLALMYAYTRNSSGDVKVVVDGFGPTDLSDSSVVNGPLGPNVAAMLGAYATNATQWHDASPLFYTQSAIPTVIFQGTADNLVPPIQSQLLQDSLANKNVPYLYEPWQGYNHGWVQQEWLQDRQVTLAWIQQFM